jgi:hypothetical protein
MAGRPKGIKKTGGRQKGSLNKTTGKVKEALHLAFDGIGGVEQLKKWAKENPTEFYKIWSKMIPQEVTGEDGGPVELAFKWLDAQK